MGTLGDIRTVERIGWLMLALPILPIVVLLSYALIAWYQVGHFPAYGNPDPRDMGMSVVSRCVLGFTLLFPYFYLLSIFSLIFLLIAGLQRRRLVRNLFIVLVVNAVYIGFMIRDALGLTNWIAD